jgi:L-ectoine synthase
VGRFLLARPAAVWENTAGGKPMIVRSLADILNTPAHVKGDAFESRRILLAADHLGYSLHDTICKAGSEQRLEYKNHVETNYVIEGQGAVTNIATGQTWPLGPGTVYVLDHHEAHLLRATTDLRIICVFTPALTGLEKHDASGSYPVLAG